MKRLGIIYLALIYTLLTGCVKSYHSQTEEASFYIGQENVETRGMSSNTNTPTCLYIGGSAMEWGWDLTDSRAVIQKVANGIYRGVYNLNFAENNGFKFWETPDYGIEYGMEMTSSLGNVTFNYRTNISNAPNGDPQFYLGSLGYQSGVYTMTIDFNTMIMTLTEGIISPLTPPTTIYIGGDTFEWGWAPHRIDGINGVFSITTSLNLNWNNENGQGFKIYLSDQNGEINYNAEYGMLPSSTGDNISLNLISNIGYDSQIYLKRLGYTSGTYHLTFNFISMKLLVSTESEEPSISSLLCDEDATEKTQHLYGNMRTLVNSGTMFGAQMPTIHGINYTSSWTASTYDTNKSDTKDLIGSHPALCGWEIGHIENNSINNLDGVPFEKIRSHIIAAYNRGAVNTISWHCNNPITDGGYNSTSPHPIQQILPGGTHHTKFLSWLDRTAEFLLSLKAEDNTLIPIIFRPWHEHTDRGQGSGFWWSVGNNSNDSYKLLWQMTFNYLTETKGVHNLIWAYSPDLHHLCWNETGIDKYVYMNAWPGDNYVDIMGLDAYQTAYSNFDASASNVVNYVADLAEEKGKLFAITETGLANNNPGHYKYFYNQQWWTNKLYPLLDGNNVAYVMVWKNDGYPISGGFPEYYNAFPGSYTSDDFITFASKEDIILENELSNIYD